MDDTQKTSSKNKLAQAIQDAAITSISEDINDIYNSIEKIINELPEQVKLQISSLREDIDNLDAGLKAVPEQFDIDFSRKINRILDVASEIELHTKKLNDTIQSDNSVQITKQAKLLAQVFNKNVEGYTVTSLTTIVVWGLSCVLIGGVISGIVAWGVVPQLFR